MIRIELMVALRDYEMKMKMMRTTVAKVEICCLNFHHFYYQDCLRK
jgi:hypothetical protein